jgi:ArsR family transcriptional regulator, arsenate/arsenite/antimonite-responsive transcriptional repressor
MSHQPVLMNQSSLMAQAMELDAAALRALADPLRRRIVQMLAAEQLCTCHLVEELDATQTNVSNHLRVLREAGLVLSEQAGRYTYHRLVPERLQELSAGLAELASRSRLAVAVKRPCG